MQVGLPDVPETGKLFSILSKPHIIKSVAYRRLYAILYFHSWEDWVIMYEQAVMKYLKARNIVDALVKNESGELDEKALLIALFVIVCISGLTALGTAVAGRFTNLASAI